MNTKIETTIPFDGFYHSQHDLMMESELEFMFSDSDTGCHVFSGLLERASDSCNWANVWESYACEYVDQFQAEFDLPTLALGLIASPREYNFSTDQIICTIELSDLEAMRGKLRESALVAWVFEHCSDQAGFHSFYSNQLSEWPESMADWEPAQVGLLIECFVYHETNDSFDWQFDLMESARCNGELTEWLENNIEGIERLYAVKEYLEKRIER